MIPSSDRYAYLMRQGYRVCLLSVALKVGHANPFLMEWVCKIKAQAMLNDLWV